MLAKGAPIVILGLFLAAAPAEAAGPRITVGPVQGDGKSVIPTQLAGLLCTSYDCVLWKEVSTNRQPDLAKARALGVRAILTGVLETTAAGKKVKLSALTSSTRPAKSWSFTLQADGRLPAAATQQLEQDLRALLVPPAAPPPAPKAAAALAVSPPPPAATTRPPPAPAPASATAPAPATASATPAEARWLAAAELGLFLDQRTLSYGGVTSSTGTLLGFDASALAGAALSLELFPLAHGASAAFGGAGLHLGLATSIGLETQDPAGDKLPTKFTRLEIGARWRSPPLTSLELVLVPDLSWVSQKLIVSPAIPGLPDSDLSGVRVGLSAEARVSRRFTILAGLGWVKWSSAKDLIEGDPAYFPGSSASALEAEVGVGVAVWGPLSLRVLGHYASTSYSLSTDPTGTYAATSAEDRYLGGRAMLRGEF